MKHKKHDWYGAGIFTFCRKCKVFLLDTIRKESKVNNEDV